MKKVISILAILMVIACTVFAKSGDTLTITASAAELKPEYILQGKLTGTDETETTFKKASTTLASVLDPTSDTITAVVQVLQNTKSRYSKPVTITVYATPFANSELSATSTILPTAAASAEKANVSGKLTSTCVPGKKDTYNALVITATYTGGFLDAETAPVVVGGGTFTWAPDESLPVGGVSTTYTATIVVEYTAS